MSDEQDRSAERGGSPASDSVGSLPGLGRIRQSYALKFALVLFLIVAIIAVLGAVAQAQVVETLEDDIEQQLVDDTETETVRLSEWIESNRVPARSASDHPDLSEDANTSAYLDELVAEDKVPERVQAVHVIDLEGRVVESTRKSTGERVTDKPYGQLFGFNRQEDVKIRGPYTNENGSTVVAAVSPVVQQVGQVLVLEVSAADVTDEFSSGIDGTFTEVVRPTAGGTETLFSNRPGDTTGQPYVPNRSQSEIPEVSTAAPNGSFRKNATKGPHLGGNYVVAYAQVEGEDWVLIKHAPATNAYQLRTDIQRGLLVFLVLALLGVIVVGGTLGRNTAGAIRYLSTQATEVKNGNYDVELDSRRQDEIGQLTDSIREMRDALRRRIQTIEHHNNQLQVLDRLLRHNLKNDMTAIKLHAQMTQEVADGPSVEHAKKIDELSDKLIDKTDKQRVITKTLASGSEEKTIDLARFLRRCTEAARERWPEADITLQAPETAHVRGSLYIGAAVTELVENATSHVDSPEIEITVTESEERVTVEIADNGPGIPDVDQRILLGNQDIDPLQHGSGIGLWLVHWVVRQSDGEIRYRETDPQGCVVVIELPAAEQSVE